MSEPALDVRKLLKPEEEIFELPARILEKYEGLLGALLQDAFFEKGERFHPLRLRIIGFVEGVANALEVDADYRFDPVRHCFVRRKVQVDGNDRCNS